MVTNLTQTPFEAIKHLDETGEHWFARELMPLLDYTEWRNFTKVVEKAKTACKNSGQQIVDHFVDVNKMVEIGSGTERNVEDVKLTRYACSTVPPSKVSSSSS